MDNEVYTMNNHTKITKEIQYKLNPQTAFNAIIMQIVYGCIHMDNEVFTINKRNEITKEIHIKRERVFQYIYNTL